MNLPRSNTEMSHFLHDYQQPKNGDFIDVVLKDFCDTFSFSYITYFAMNLPVLGGETLLKTNYPDSWKKCYFGNNYDAIDPVIELSRRRHVPLNWSDLPPAHGKVEDFFTDARKHGLGSVGMTVPIRGRFGEFVLVTVNAETSLTEWSDLWALSLPDFAYFASLLHSHVLEAIGLADWSGPRLSSREAEVMAWAIEGKSAWDTAQLTGLSERTVQSYTRNVCMKLGVTTKTQAVARIVRENLISPPVNRATLR